MSSLTKDKKRKRTLKGDGPSEAKKTRSEAQSQACTYSEEDEIDKSDPLQDLQMQKAACTEIRTLMTEIEQLKQGKNPDTAKIAELRIQGSLQFLVLKKLNRLAHMRGKKVRDATNEAKQKIDQYHLQLQNLLYEVMHLQKEITKCLEFKSKDEEIELVDVEEFYKDAPSEISKPDVTKQDKHQLTLARLDWELEQRKRLSEKLKDAETNKEVISEEIKNKKEYLESLQPKLNTILQSTKPVQEYLNMPFDEIREQHQTAQHLPHPLYVLYMQSSAYQEACDENMSVNIQGDVEQAKRMLLDTTQDIEEESDSDQEEQEQEVKRKSKHRRATTENKLTLKRHQVLRKHPLSVVLAVKCIENSTLQLTFSYMVTLKIITVTVRLLHTAPSTSVSGSDLLTPDSLLSCLYPGDYGTDTPNPANQFELNRAGMEKFSTYIQDVGYPYMWAQWLGGLQFLNDGAQQSTQAADSAAHTAETIKRLRKRVAARLSLQKQLVALEHNTIAVSGDYITLFPPKISCHLVGWTRSTYEDFAALKYTECLIEQGLASESSIFFTAAVERGSAKMTVSVAVCSDYPRTPPVFAVNIHWKTDRSSLNDSNVRDMEAEVNIYYDELKTGKSADQLLTNQLQRLLMCFDIYLETEVDNSGMEGPIEFPKEKICPRTLRGPGRTKPYQFHPKLGMFTQR